MTKIERLKSKLILFFIKKDKEKNEVSFIEYIYLKVGIYLLKNIISEQNIHYFSRFYNKILFDSYTDVFSLVGDARIFSLLKIYKEFDEIVKKSNEGNLQAKYSLAYAYECGLSKKVYSFDKNNEIIYEEKIILNKDTQKALTLYKEIAKKNYMNTVESVIRCYINIEKYDELLDYIESLEKNDALSYIAGICCLKIFNKTNQESYIDKAIKFFEKSLKFSMESHVYNQTLLNLGLLYFKKNNLKKSEEYFSKSTHDEQIIAYYLAYIKYIKKKKNSEKIIFLKQLIEESDENTYYNLFKYDYARLLEKNYHTKKELYKIFNLYKYAAICSNDYLKKSYQKKFGDKK